MKKNRSKSGPPGTEFSPEEKTEFLRLRRNGFGMHNTLRRMGVGRGRYVRTINADRDFRSEAEHVDDELNETLVSLRLRAALGGDQQAIEYLINRFDRSKQFTANMSLKRKQLKIAEGLIHEQSLEELDRLDDGEGSGDSAAAEG